MNKIQYLIKHPLIIVIFIVLNLNKVKAQSLTMAGCLFEMQKKDFCTLRELKEGGIIEVGDKIFKNWMITFSDLSNSPPDSPPEDVILNDIIVFPIEEENLDIDPGLKYIFESTSLEVNENKKEKLLNFKYQVDVKDSQKFLIKDNLLRIPIDPPGFGFMLENNGLIKVKETVRIPEDTEDPLARKMTILQKEAGQITGSKDIDKIDFENAQDSLLINTDILVSNLMTNETASLIMLEQRFSQVQLYSVKTFEPSYISSLLAFGIFGIFSATKSKLGK